MNAEPTPQELRRIGDYLEESTPEAILTWAFETYGPRLAIASSFGGPTSMVVMDMASRIVDEPTVYYLDTGLLFDETYALVDTVRDRYGIDPIALKPDLTVAEQTAALGPDLWERDPDACCTMRKLAPQSAFLSDYGAWVTGLRRDQAATREQTPVVQWDEQFSLGKINPLARWSERDVWAYVERHGVPCNPLLGQGYPSIGCRPCTRKVAPGESLRAGRWSGSGKIECGLHPAQPKAGRV